MAIPVESHIGMAFQELRTARKQAPCGPVRAGAVRCRWYNLRVANLAVRRRRFRASALVLALACLVGAQFAAAIDPRAVPALVAAGVGFAAAGGGFPGLILAIFGAGLAPLDTTLRIAFGIGALAVFDRASRRGGEGGGGSSRAVPRPPAGAAPHAYFTHLP